MCCFSPWLRASAHTRLPLPAASSWATRYGSAWPWARGSAYYSLSSVLISQAGFIDIGTIALISNLIREAYALLLSPLVARFSPFAAISIGGCTTMDTTLPVMVSALGSDWAFTSIVHAIVLDFTVPFAVIFFCSLF